MDIKKLVFDLVGCKWNGPVEEIATSDLIVKFDGQRAVIGSNTIPAKAGVSAMGFGEEHLRLPLTPMEDATRAVLFAEMRKLGIHV